MFMRILGRSLLAFGLAISLVVASLVFFPLARAVDSRTFVPFSAAVPSLPEGTPLEITLGAGGDRTINVRNGDDFEIAGTPDATGMTTVIDPEGELVAIAVVPKVPGLSIPRRELNDESSAVGLIFSLPGFVAFSVLEDAMLVDAAYSVPELTDASEAIARQRESGTNPLEEPNLQTLEAVGRLFAAADAELGNRFDRLLAAIEVNLRASSSANAASITMAASRTSAHGARSLMAPSQIDTTGLSPACEIGIDDPGLCGNDQDSRPCAVTYPGVVLDSDGLDGDSVCIVARGFNPAENTVELAGTNFLSRWTLVYTASNDSLIPDAMLEPKRWTLPSVEQFAIDLAKLGATTQIDSWRTFIPGFNDLVVNLFGQAELEGDFEDRLADRVLDLFRSYSSPPTSDFNLSVGAVGGPPTGVRFTTYAFGFPREPLDSQWDRWLLSLSMTAITEWVIPSLQIALDLSKTRGASFACHPYNTNTKSQFVNELNRDRNAREMDLCSAVLTLSAVFIPIFADTLAQQEAPDATDYINLGAEMVSALFTLVRDSVFPKSGGWIRQTEIGGREFADQIVVAGRTVSSEEVLSGVQDATVAIFERDFDLSEVQDLINAAVVGVIVFVLGTTDLTEIAVNAFEAAVKRALSALIPGAGMAATIIQFVDTAVKVGNIAAGVGEVIMKRDSTDTRDTYVVSVDGLKTLPLSTNAAFGDGASSISSAGGTTLLVIDVSGSMADPALDAGESGALAKIDAARDSASALASVATLGRDRGVAQAVGIAVFSNEAVTIAEPSSDFNLLEERLGALGAGGGTNIDAGLAAALDALEGVDGFKRIVLLSDGADGVDPQGAHILSGSVARARSAGIRIDTIAFDLQDVVATDLMRNIALESGGRFGEAATASELTRLFVGSQHAATGQVVDWYDGPMLGRSATVDIDVRPDSGIAPAEMLITVVLNGEEYSLKIVDANGVELVPSKVETLTSGGVTNVTLSEPPLGRLILTVTRTGGVAEEPGDASPAMLNETSGEFVFVNSRTSAADVRVPELIVVASVSGAAEVAVLREPSQEQRLLAMGAAVGWMSLLLGLGVAIVGRRRRSIT